MDTIIGNPTGLWLIAMVFVTAALGAGVAWRRRRVRQRMGESWQAMATAGNRNTAPWMQTALLCGTFLFLAISLMDLRWGKVTHDIPQKGIEVVFALDVSRSMLADDVSPSRLDRAKQQIKDLMEEMAGDRVALVAFAGDARSVIPLTRHYEDFKNTLDGVGPHTVRRGGSRLGDAIELAANGFMSKTNEHRVIVVLTDGEDQESEPVKVAAKVHEEMGARIFTIGLGDWQQGARVPGREDRRGRSMEPYLKYDGQTVWSKLDGTTLKEIALATEGAYIPAGTKYVDMGQVYRRYIAPIEKTEFETATVDAYEARFQWFALPAFLCLAAEVWLATRRASAAQSATLNQVESLAAPSEKGHAWKQKAGNTRSPSASTVVAGGLVFAFGLTIGGGAEANAQSGWRRSPMSTTISAAPREQAQTLNAASRLVQQGKYSEALEAFDGLSPEVASDWWNYNRGLALYGNNAIIEAADSFRQAASAEDAQLASAARYNLGNCLVELAQQEEGERALKGLRQAIESYRDALRLEPDMANARANLEVAYQKLKQLQQENSDPTQEDPTPSSAGQQSQTSNTEEESSQQQRSDSSNSQEGSQQQGQQQEKQPGGQQSESDAGSDGQPSESQSASGESADSESEDAGESSESQDNEGSSQPKDRTGQDEGTDQSQEGEANTGENGDSKSQTDPNSPGSPTDPLSDSANRTSDSLDPSSTGEQNDSGETPEGDVGSSENGNQGDNLDGELSSVNQEQAAGTGTGNETKGQAMTMQEAMKMLQSIRDREYRRRLELQRRERARRVQVERDW